MVSESVAFRNLNVSVFLHFLARQVYSIFVPVVMLQNGYSLPIVLLFLVLSSLVTIFSSYNGQKYMTQRNVIYFNYFAVASEIALLVLLIFSGFSALVFTGIFLFEGFYYAFYYLSYWSITTYYTSKEETGNNLGNLTISVALASIIGPLLGAYILEGSKYLLSGFAASLLFLSLIPLFKISNLKVEQKASGKVNFGEIKNQIFNYIIMSSFEVVIFVLWGIYAFINDFGLLNIGLIVSSVSVARIILSQIIKDRLSNDDFRKKVMAVSALGLMAASIYRYYMPEQILFTNLLMAAFYVGFQLGTQTGIINSVKGKRTYYSSMILQTTTFVTRIFVYLLAFLLGLKTIILLPIVAGTAYILFSS